MKLWSSAKGVAVTLITFFTSLVLNDKINVRQSKQVIVQISLYPNLTQMLVAGICSCGRILSTAQELSHVPILPLAGVSGVGSLSNLPRTMIMSQE